MFVLGRQHPERLEQVQLLLGGPNQALEFSAVGIGLDGPLP